MENKVSARLIEAIKSNSENGNEASWKSSARLEGPQELADRQAFLAHRQVIEELKSRLKDTVTDPTHSFPKSISTTYHAGIRNVFDRVLAKVTRVCGTTGTEGTPKAHMVKWTCVCFLKTYLDISTNFLTLHQSKTFCGRVLIDKYVEKQVGAVEKFQMLLKTYSSRRWKEGTLPVVEAEGTAQPKIEKPRFSSTRLL